VGPGLRQSVRALPVGLIGMLVLVAGVESLVARRSLGLLNAQGLGLRFAAAAAAREAPGCAVLALGDSTVKVGFDPLSTAGPLGPGRPSYNLAVAGAPTPVAWALYRRARAAGAQPEAVVFGCLSLMGEPRGRPADFAEVMTPAEALRLSCDCHDARLFAAMIARMVLPSLRCREGLRFGAAALVGAGPRPFGGLAAARWCFDAWADRRGADPHLLDGRFNGRLDPNLARQLNTEVWSVNPVYLLYAHRLAEEAARDGVPLFWLIPPIAPEAQARRDASGLDARNTTNLRLTVGTIPGVVVLDARRAGYAAELFADAFHLNARGAERLSTDVAAAVVRRLASHDGPRWLALNPAPAAAAPAPIASRPAPDNLIR
jgi:hypothetical protein